MMNKSTAGREDLGLEDLRSAIGAFIQERDWEQFHSPKNLAMALSVEVAEIVEHFQWLTEEDSKNLPPGKLAEVREEIGDVMIYLTELADKLGIDPVEAAKEKVDGLHLCERHALEVKLEGQISCWGEMLFHIELWSREASRRQREDVVGLLEDQLIEATSARQKAYADLDVLRRSERPWEPRTEQPPTRRGSLLVLPPGGARQLSGGLRRLRRR